jgi:hypothetical protein
VAVGDGARGVGEGVEVEEDLVSRLLLVDVVDRQIQVVRSDRALGTLVHII